ncbi:hypothetical protein [Streptomyces fimicarius]|uniref:hypothetical protein n=1 Tax=Streptomyces TaxID=1883 RepID=UPI0036A02B18
MTVQHPIAQALLAMVPGARPDATRVTIEHAYAQLDVQSVDSWTGTVDGLACRVAEHLRTTAPENLYLALAGDSAPSLTIYRAEHDTIVAGRYTTSEAAQQHCEALVSREYPASASLFFEWCVDESDPAGLELDICVDDKRLSTGYAVTPLEVAIAYDPDADE